MPEIDESVDTGIRPPAGLGSGLFVATKADEPEAAIKLLEFVQFKARGVEKEHRETQ